MMKATVTAVLISVSCLASAQGPYQPYNQSARPNSTVQTYNNRVYPYGQPIQIQQYGQMPQTITPGANGTYTIQQYGQPPAQVVPYNGGYQTTIS